MLNSYKNLFKYSLGIIAFSYALTAAAQPSCQIALSAIHEASAIRGLKQKNSVPCELHNQEQVRKFIQAEVDKQTSLKKFQYEEQALKFVTYLPQDYDYKKGIVDLYTSQIGGYYDPAKKYYVMAAWLPEIMQPPIAVHELTHALQDQYFDLKKLTDDTTLTIDETLALQALVEGDATAVMTDFAMKPLGKSLKDAPDVEGMMMQNVLGMGLATGLINVPDTVKFTLLFPYNSGLRFVHYLIKKGGYKESDKAFNNPPRSTKEILHPEKYQGSRPGKLFKADEKFPYRDTLGEFVISTILARANDPKIASDVAAGWEDDVVEINGAGKKWTTTWKDAQAAKGFYEAFERCLFKEYGEKAGNKLPELKLSGNRVELTGR